jgi:hypothetical protein
MALAIETSLFRKICPIVDSVNYLKTGLAFLEIGLAAGLQDAWQLPVP